MPDLRASRPFSLLAGSACNAASGTFAVSSSTGTAMPLRRAIALLLSLCPLAVCAASASKSRAFTPSTHAILAVSKPSEWRTPDPNNLLVMQLSTGRVLIELAPDFAPLHVANIRKMARAHYYDGLAITRVQDNFVTQWGDPASDNEKDKSALRSLGEAKATLPPEFTRSIDPKLPWTPLPDGDVYAPQVGFTEGFPAARDPVSGREWLTHCYGMVGVGRDNGPRSGSGAELYAVIGQAPRRLDRNLAVVGRVVEGMPLLSGLPRGGGAMGFYADPAKRIMIKSERLAADLPPAQRPRIQILRTTSKTFAQVVEAKRNRHDAFYAVPAGKVGLCSVDIPVRQ